MRGSGSSLGSLDGLKEAPSVSFLDISPAKAGGESPSLRRRRGKPQGSTRVVRFKQQVQGEWNDSASPHWTSFLGPSPPQRPGEKKERGPEWRDALAVFGHRFLAKSRNTFLSMIPSSMIVPLESSMTGTRSPYFCSRTRSRSTSTSSRLADPNTWLARAIPSSHRGQPCLVYMRMDTIPAYRQINGAMGVARVT
jgi:hypothetical protein